VIPKDKIEEVRDRASIVAVISEYMALTKRGANHVGLCPFHSEKTPSFTVSEEKRLYHCFGCNASGDVIGFVMKKEGLEFPDAVRLLARRYGVTIVEERARRPGAREMMLKALSVAAAFFSESLRSPAGARARRYLEERGFAPGTGPAGAFSLGFAPDSWDSLSKRLARERVSMEAAEKAGLVKKRESGGYYDRFRGRIIFPITDVRGTVVGFGGRVLDDATPKYLNSPESPVFRKGETLYGLHQARQAVRQEGFAIVVEGYFDLLSLHAHGFINSVATMGTALGAGQIRTLKGYAPAVCALFDPDEAGKRAALRVLPLFIEADVPCRVVLLPGGKDPDEFIRLNGAGAMREALARAVPLMEFYLMELESESGISTPEGKRAYFDGAIEYINKLSNAAERGHYVTYVATTLGIPASSVYAALGASGPKGRPAARAATPARGRSRSRSELAILKVIAAHPELFDERVAEAIGVFGDGSMKRAGEALAAHLGDGSALDAASVMEGIEDPETRGVVAGLFIEDDGFVEDAEKMLEDSLKRVLKRDTIKDATREMIRRLEESGRRDVAGAIEKRFSSRGRAGER